MDEHSEKSPSPAVSCSVRLYEHKLHWSAKHSFQLKLGDHVRVEAEHIQRYCFVEDDLLLDDLASVLSAVRMADRACNRQHGKGWARALNVEVPVYDLPKWQLVEVMDALTDALRYLTGDKWHFKFMKRKSQSRGAVQAHVVDLPAQERIFMPYSNGLDSFAIANQIRKNSSKSELILVNVQAAQRLKNWKSLARARDEDLHAVQVAVFFKEPLRTEPTFRSRPFIYDMLAGYGAALAQPARVVIPENGQGSLGGSLVTLGDEAPHRSCHPGFTIRLTRLINALTNVSVKFEHPALFQTKGQVLAHLASHNPASDIWLAAHRSCSYDARHSSQDKRTMHCGVCGNCLLRRVAMHWAGVKDTTEYRAADLTATTFEGSFVGTMPRIQKSNHDVAFNSIRAMQRMSDLANSPQNVRVASEVASLSRSLGEPIREMRTKMEQFIQQHKTEWSQFLDVCGPRSWVADLARN
jgi:7-cyano-7-deazaguanine synthase in queuosine biosynthesis